jgi:CBS domain-containing protein
MRVIDATRRSGVAVPPDKTVRSAAQIMEQAGVGALAIIEGPRLLGIVTDRDLVRRALAKGLPPDARVDAVMSSPVVTVDADADLSEAFALFRTNAIRRLAILRGGQFVGVLSVDDLLIDLATELTALTRPVRQEVFKSQRESVVPAVAV